MVMDLHGQIFEFEFEGPKNLHLPVATLEALQHRRLPSIARVCREMRDYAVRAHSRIKVEFTCDTFGIEAVHQLREDEELVHYSIWQIQIEHKGVTAYFDPQRDQIRFKRHEWSRVPQDLPAVSIEEDELGDILFRYDTDAPNAPRNLTFAASSILAKAPRTEFEELVLGEWGNASSQHHEIIQEYELVTYDATRSSEDITRLFDGSGDKEQVDSVCRSYGLVHVQAFDTDVGTGSPSARLSEPWHELDQRLRQAQTIDPQYSSLPSLSAQDFRRELLRLEEQNKNRLALAREEASLAYHQLAPGK